MKTFAIYLLAALLAAGCHNEVKPEEKPAPAEPTDPGTEVGLAYSPQIASFDDDLVATDAVCIYGTLCGRFGRQRHRRT